MRPLVLLLIGAAAVALTSDPYSSLGVKSTASIKEIKRAYKQLAKEWHPDKNDSPNASERFMAISKAYEILNDPQKKERYDKFGVVDDGQPHGGGSPFGGGFDPFFHNPFHHETGNSWFAQHRISHRQYAHGILEKSYSQPFLIFAYSGYCGLCYQHEAMYKAAADDLEPLGYGIAAVNAQFDRNLLDVLRVNRLPTILSLVEGRIVHFRGDMMRINSKAIRVFARDVMPESTLLRIATYDKLRRFIDQAAATNKASVLILGAAPEPRLRYLLAAMRLGAVDRFAYVHLGEGTPEIAQMREALSIKCTQCENILIFNEFPEKGPVGRLSISKASELTRDSLDSLLDAHRFLLLPRISSHAYLDGLCPLTSRTQRELCVLLVATDASDTAADTFRTFASKNAEALGKKKVRLAYISAATQSAFLRPLMEARSKVIDNDARDIMIMWRGELVRGKMMWLEGAWPTATSAAPAGVRLLQRIEDVLSGRTKLEITVQLGDLIDEHKPSLFTRFSKSIVAFLQNGWFHLTKEETYPVLAVVFTFLVILGFGYVLSAVKEAEKVKMRQSPHGSYGPTRTTSTDSGWHPEDPKCAASAHEGETLRPPAETAAQQHKRRVKRAFSVMQPLIHELRAESYFGMIRLLKPGCRSIIVLVDAENKQQLLEQFALCIYPLRNNKTFSFGYLMVEKNLPWFRKLLEHTLPAGNDDGQAAQPSMYQRLQSINPKQTIGTVLVLCGWKLYFCIYHPMHVPAGKKNFLGFEDDGETDDGLSDDEDGSGTGHHHLRETLEDDGVERKHYRPSVSNVLNGFPNWLDRLLEGSARRYYIPEWPDNLH